MLLNSGLTLSLWFFLLSLSLSSPLPDVHRLHPGGREPLPDPAHLHGGADQAVQGEEDRGAAAAHLRHRGQLLHAHEEDSAEPGWKGLKKNLGKFFKTWKAFFLLGKFFFKLGKFFLKLGKLFLTWKVFLKLGKSFLKPGNVFKKNFYKVFFFKTKLER